MRPGTMKSVRCFQKFHHLFQPFNALLPGDKLSLYAHQNGHDSESAASAGHYVFVVQGVNIVNMKTFACQSTVWLRPVPEVLKGGTLYIRENIFVSGRK